MIDITLLGTAALMPIPGRALTSVFLSCSGHSILFDCGEGTQTAARKAGISLMKTDIIALTHYHGDHIFGLPGLLQTMCSMTRTQPLYITGPRGLKQALVPILTLAGPTTFEIRFIEISEDGLQLCDLDDGWPAQARLSCFKTAHRVPSYGYCFSLDRVGKFLPECAQALGIPVKQWGNLQKGESVQVGDIIVNPAQVLGEPRKGLKFVFTGDTTTCRSLIDSARDADLLISEATYGEDEQAEMAIEYGHMNFAQAAQVAAQAGVKQLCLAHFSQMVGDPQQYLPNAQKIFSHTVCGQDGMNFTLSFEK